MRNLLTLILVTFNILVCIGIVYASLNIVNLIKLNNRILGTSTIVPIRKESLIFPTDAELKNFYELQTNQVIEEKPVWLPYISRYTFNSDGLNERYDYAINKPPNTIRIITMGDSFTFGQYVDTRENWTEILEDLLNESEICSNKKIEVINLGVYGYDLVFATHRFKVRGMKYTPDLVLWLLNDHNFYVMPQFTKEKVDFYEKELNVEDKKIAADQGKFYPALELAYKEISKLYTSAAIAEQEYGALYEFAKYYQGFLVLLSSALTQDHRNLLRIFSDSREGTTMINDKNILAWKIEGASVKDGHPNKKGHQLMAEDILGYLMKNKLVNCE